MDDLGNLKRFALAAGGNMLPVGEIDWSRVRVIAWFDPVEVPSASTAVDAEVPDQLLRFLAERTEQSDGARVRSCELYDAFDAWCVATGMHPWRQKGFSRAMSDAGYQKMARNGMWWLGLNLKSQQRDGGQ